MYGGISERTYSQEDQPIRDGLLDAAKNLGAGAFFTAKDLGVSDKSQALERMVGHDVLQVGNGLYVCVVQGRYLRRPPTMREITATWSSRTGAALVPAGELDARALGLAQHDPITGFRYYSDGPTMDATIKRVVHLRIVRAAGWMLSTDEPHRMIRAIGDLGLREARIGLARLITSGCRLRVESALAALMALDADHDRFLTENSWMGPAIDEALSHKDEPPRRRL